MWTMRIELRVHGLGVRSYLYFAGWIEGSLSDSPPKIPIQQATGGSEGTVVGKRDSGNAR